MSHRYRSGRMVCGLSKWDTEKANRLFIHVLIWWLFWSLLSHFHFKCQWTSFGLCHHVEAAHKFSISFSCNLSESSHGPGREKKKEWTSFYFSCPPPVVLEGEERSGIRACAAKGGGRSWVMANESKPGKRHSQHSFTCLGVGWCKQMQSLCKLLILWTVKSSLWKQEN